MTTQRDPKSLTIESAYFHTGNSGITFSIKQVGRRRGDKSYRLEIMHGAHGAHSTISVPLDCDHMAEWFAGAMTRLHTRMRAEGFEALEPFAYGRKDTAERHIEVINGLKREPIYKEYVDGPFSTVTKIVGYNFFDHNGTLMKTLTLAMPLETGASDSCGGGEPLFKPSDYGKEVVDGKVVG